MSTEVPEEEHQKLGTDIVKGFHEQFAQNQNHHQSLFLQVLTVLLTVLVGFGYIYIRVDADSDEVKVTVESLYAFLALALYLLSLGVALILNMALGFRRDQMVACNIRVKTGVMAINDEGVDLFFPPAFNPVPRTGIFDWLPGFHQVFYVALFIVKGLLIFSVLLNPDFMPTLDLNKHNAFIAGAVLIAMASLVVDRKTTRYFRRKWLDTVKSAPERLKVPQDKSQR